MITTLIIIWAVGAVAYLPGFRYLAEKAGPDLGRGTHWTTAVIVTVFWPLFLAFLFLRGALKLMFPWAFHWPRHSVTQIGGDGSTQIRSTGNASIRITPNMTGVRDDLAWEIKQREQARAQGKHNIR